MLPLRIACSTELRIKGRGRRDASLTNRGYDAHLVTLSRGRSSCQGRRLVCPTGKSGVTSSSRKSKIRRPTLSCGLRLRAENCFCFTKKSQIVSTRRCPDGAHPIRAIAATMRRPTTNSTFHVRPEAAEEPDHQARTALALRRRARDRSPQFPTSDRPQ